MHTDLTQEEAQKLLEQQTYGHLACYLEGEIYLVPITYIYEDGEIISYTHEGKKIDMLREGAVVCVQVEQVESQNQWQSVICWGDFEELTDHDVKQAAALKIAEKFAESRDAKSKIYSPLIEDISALSSDEEDTPVMYRITVTKMTGRQEKPE